MTTQNNVFDDDSDQDYDFDDDNYRAAQSRGGSGGGGLRRKQTFFNSKKSASGACYKGCYLVLKKCFSYLFPKRPYKTRNNHSDWLRAYLGWSLVLHIMFFVLSLIYIGFWAMITNLFLALWSYSCYLTLRTT